MKAYLGLDFGTLSARAIIVSADGRELGSSVSDYRHGQITECLPGWHERLPSSFAFQHPLDWLESASTATRAAMEAAGSPEIGGIGVDFTSCTMLPAKTDGTPLCLDENFRNQPQAWPKLWKHHGAIDQAERMTRIARERNESFLARYGGVIGEEWLFPKILEAMEKAPDIHAATGVWLEAGDWFVWQLVAGPAETLPRSTCQAGYKGLWSAADGYPTDDYLAAVHPELPATVANKMPGRFVAPGCEAGKLDRKVAEDFGLTAGIPVSAAIIDAHSGIPGVGASEAGTLVMVMGTSSCHMLNSENDRAVAGVAGIVRDGILPGFYGYETGQAAVGDAFDWLRRLTGHDDFSILSKQATALPPGAEGVRCLDWFNGCRTPHMNAGLTGAFTGLTLHHGAAHLHRALMEASACGVRWIVEILRDAGVPVKSFLATGGLPHHDPYLVQIYADVLGETVEVPMVTQAPALGAAMLGALAAGDFDSPSAAIEAMKDRTPSKLFHPSPDADYSGIYADYRALAKSTHSK